MSGNAFLILLATLAASPALAQADSTDAAGSKQVRVNEPGGGPSGPPEVEWTRTFEGWGSAAGYCVQQTSDGGYVAVGHTNSPDSATWAATLLVKLDASGNTEWVKTFKGVGGMRGASVIQTSDGGFVVAGTAAVDEWAGHWDPYLVRTDTSGNELWQSRLANDASADAWSVVGVGDTAYSVVARESWGDSAVMLYGIDGSGNIGWGRAYNVSYGFAQDDEKLSLCRTADGGFIVGTKTLLKLDSLGAQPQLKTFGSLGNANSVIQTSDGGYAATGVTSDCSNIYLLKTNANLDWVWMRTYLPSEWSRGQWVEQKTDGGYIICGTTRPGDGSDKVTLVGTLSDGTQEWVDTLFDGYGYSVRQTADGGYVVCGLYYDSTAGPEGTSYLFVSKLASGAWRQ